jgi:hypothetical protein
MARNWMRKLWKYFLELNIYKKSCSTVETLLREQWATRIYFVSLLATVLSIAIVASASVRTINKIEYLPTSSKFLYLQAKYPNTLQCPCTKVGINYGTFVSAHVNFHQVCSSDYVKQSWIDELFADRNISTSILDDFESIASFFWQTVAGFCNVSNETWITTLGNFHQTTIFSLSTFSKEYIQEQAETTLKSEITLAKTTLTHNLLAIQSTTAANGFVSALGTNFYWRFLQFGQESSESPQMSPRMFANCSCLNVNGCQRPAFIETNESNTVVRVPGMIIDCLVVDTTLASTLECYYSRECINLLHKENGLSVTPLLTTLNNQFSVQSTIQEMFDAMMIDKLKVDSIFDSFYTQCHPAYCSYSYNKRFDPLFVITIILGIFGGLSFVLQQIAPLTATIILSWRDRHKREPTLHMNFKNLWRNLCKCNVSKDEIFTD